MAAILSMWSLGKVSELLDLYEERPCLYNTQHKDYHNRDLRSKALKELSAACGFPGKLAYN